jgi:hypothetical protein
VRIECHAMSTHRDSQAADRAEHAARTRSPHEVLADDEHPPRLRGPPSPTMSSWAGPTRAANVCGPSWDVTMYRREPRGCGARRGRARRAGRRDCLRRCSYARLIAIRWTSVVSWASPRNPAAHDRTRGTPPARGPRARDPPRRPQDPLRHRARLHQGRGDLVGGTCCGACSAALLHPDELAPRGSTRRNTADAKHETRPVPWRVASRRWMPTWTSSSSRSRLAFAVRLDREARISFEQSLRELRPLAWAP